MEYSDKNGHAYKYNAWCKTDTIKGETFTFLWSISDFSSRTEENGEVLNSEEFTIKGPDNKITKWRGQIYPRGSSQDFIDNCSVFLQKLSAEEEVHASYVLSFLNTNKEKQRIKKLPVTKFSVGENKRWGWCLYNRRSDLSQPDDILTLFFDITIIGETKNSIEFMYNVEEKCPALTENYHRRQLSQDFETHFLSKEHSDVIIKCGDKLYDCHKFILTSRSPVFKSMIESDMKEKISGEVEIKNMDHDVLEDLLKYIYSGVAPKVDKLTQGLLTAADQYHLEQLKELCELKLCSRLDISNCIELLILGDLHNAQKLKAKALEFVSKNMQKMKPSEWKQSFIAHPALMAEVMERVLPKNDDEEDTAEIKKRTAS